MTTWAAVKKKLEPVWWILGVVVAIGTVGYMASEKLGEFETRTAARDTHTAQDTALSNHNAAAEAKRETLTARIDQAEDEVQAAKLRDVRMEAQQRNVDDRIQILIELGQAARTVSGRREQQERIVDLERDIQVRERAIKRSLLPPARPIRPGTRRDPMVGLDELR